MYNIVFSCVELGGVNSFDMMVVIIFKKERG